MSGLSAEAQYLIPEAEALANAAPGAPRPAEIADGNAWRTR